MKNLLATAYWADDPAKMARMAGHGARGRGGPVRSVGRVRAAFQKEFVREDGRPTVEQQTAYAALAFDLLPLEARPRAAERLVANIRELDWHLSTGFIGIATSIHAHPRRS